MRKGSRKKTLFLSINLVSLIIVHLVFFYPGVILITTGDFTVIPISGNHTLYVGGQGEHNYTTIQEAIESASPGSTIFIYKGAYMEHIILNKTLALEGENRHQTIIDAGGQGTVITILSNNCRISNITITNSGLSDDIQTNSGIYCGQDSSHIFNTIISQNKYGISCYRLLSPVVHNTTFYNNYEGIHLENISHAAIKDNVFSGNVIAISFIQSSKNTLYDCHTSFDAIGIYLFSSTDNIIRGCIFSNNSQMGVYSHHSFHNQILDNNFEYCGLNLVYSPNHIILNNSFSYGGISLFGGGVNNYVHTLDSSNVVNDKPVWYFLDQNNQSIDHWEGGQFIFVNCTYFTVRNLTIAETDQALEISFSHHNLFDNLTLFSSSSGIHLYKSTNNTIARCTIHNNSLSGINLTYSSNKNIIFGSTLRDMEYYGILFSLNCSENHVSQCTVSQNNYGLSLMNCADNMIYSNNFFNNRMQATDDGINHWNKDGMGNYWSNFDHSSEGAWDNDTNGLIDTPYRIPRGDNQDYYPLAEPWSPSHDNLPQVTISYPSMYATVQGIVTITGTAHDKDGTITRVEISVDGHTWEIAKGTASWLFSWDTTYLPNAVYPILARSFDGLNYSSVQTLFVTVHNTYILSIHVIPQIGGSIIINPQGDSYEPGTLVNVTAIPDEGYMFTNWTGDITGSDPHIEFIMTTDKFITAHFTKIAQQYTLMVTVTPTSSGAIILDPPGGKYTPGTCVTVTAIPQGGYRFSRWDGDFQGTNASIQVVMNSDASLFAYFEATSSSNQPPIAYFTFSSDGLTVYFNDKSSDIDGAINAWRWDFGDNTTSQQQFPMHTYDQEGKYEIILTVTDNLGDYDSYTVVLRVKKGGGGLPGFEWITLVGVIAFLAFIQKRYVR